ncbi:MAG: xanthine dehydrogenase family protein molybdopterin-binding subunit [Betaproteobacteria bacterium]|nr:MAG: xanthine dehydrogenase family protein molybdopterin-binding subunit [Betaproteobacteria bacterium]
MKQPSTLKDKIESSGRRGFMKSTGALSGALVIGFNLPFTASQAKTAPPAAVANAWVKVSADGKVTLICHRSEMGQGVYTSMPMLVAEELGVPLSSVKIEMAPSAPVYINAMLGGQITGGSTSVRDAWMKLREAGASARTVLVAAAADTWKVPASECTVANGMVMHKSGKKIAYGKLVAKASSMKMPEKVALKAQKDWTIIGKNKARLDTPAKVYGTAQYGIDVKLPGMVIASLAQAPVIGGKAVKVNDAKTKALKGVLGVVQIPDGVAVLAKDFYIAKKGRDLLEIEWDNGPAAGLDNLGIEQDLRTASLGSGAIMRKDGAGVDAMSKAASTIEAEYLLPFLAHATLEPVNCTAEIKNGECHITGPIQFQQGAQYGVAAAIKMPPEKVFIHTTFLGGGYGRKLELDFQIQAAQLAMAAGKPVKLIWSREDDMKHDFYRPISLHQMTAGLNAKGDIESLHCKMTSPSVTARAFPPVVQNGKDPFMAEGSENITYKVPNLSIENVIHDTGVRVGYWRSVSNALNAFAVESFIDEVATATKKDPVAMRMGMLGHDKRSQNVLKMAADKAGWGKAPAGRALGVAQMECYGAHSALVAEVSMTKDGPKVHKITCVVDCGVVVHPDQALAQMESGILLGFSSGMKNEITFSQGEVQQNNFHDYAMLRMSEVPQIDVTFVQSSESPGGLGEVGVPLVMPAIANALASLNGKRVRRLPLLQNV